MSYVLRALGPKDLGAVKDLLAQRPVETLFLSSKLEQFGFDNWSLGAIHGFERDGELTAVCLDGGTLFPAGIEPDAIPAFVEAVGERRNCASILGPSIMALGMYLGLSTRYRGDWVKVVNVRDRQPLMVLDTPPLVDPDPRVRTLAAPDYEPYLKASVAMYTDEIGASPFKHGPGYGSFVRARLLGGDAWGIVESGRVIFKADLGPRLGPHAQLQGVWLEPALRNQGLAAPMLSGMLTLAQRRHPVISLYVNDFNTPAIRLYERLGFRQVGSLSTIHY